MNNVIYREKRRYRYHGTRSGAFFLPFMEERFQHGFSSLWEQFGYEIGGPVCYSFVRWLAAELNRSEDVTGVAFVARDGYLLQKTFEALPIVRRLKTHYVYATRAVAQACGSQDARKAYHAYLASMDFGEGTVGVVDTVTMEFSSQRLLTGELEHKTRGYFWTVLRSAKDFGRDCTYRTFQEEPYHLVRCWNLIEFILTSPEPPISAVREGKPVYNRVTPQEADRKQIFEQVEKGVSAFVDDLCKRNAFPEIGYLEIVKWVNDYLKHPDPEDIRLFSSVMISENDDHSEYIPLDPFSRKKPFKALKDRLWLFSQRHKTLYSVLHRIRRVVNRKEK